MDVVLGKCFTTFLKEKEIRQERSKEIEEKKLLGSCPQTLLTFLNLNKCPTVALLVYLAVIRVFTRLLLNALSLVISI